MVSLAALLAFALGGCGALPPLTPRAQPVAPAAVRETVSNVAVVPLAEPPRLRLDGMPSAARSAGDAGLNVFFQCLGAAGHGMGGGGSFAGALFVLMGGVCTASAGVTAAFAAATAPSPEQVDLARVRIEAASRRDRIQTEFASHVARALSGPPGIRLVQLDPATIQRIATTHEFRGLPADAIDHVIEVGISEYGTESLGMGGPGDLVLCRVTVHARLVRVADGGEAFAGDFRYTSEPRTPEEWAQGGGAWFGNALANAYAHLSERVRDQFFLVYPFPYASYNRHGTSWYVGLQAELPGERATVDTPNPQLRWEGFPRAHDREAAADRMARVDNVRYDLRVAQVMEGEKVANGAIVYRRDELVAPHHQVTSALRPGATYAWTVRARFSLDGRRYVTPWATTFGDDGETGPGAWYRLTVGR